MFQLGRPAILLLLVLLGFMAACANDSSTSKSTDQNAAVNSNDTLSLKCQGSIHAPMRRLSNREYDRSVSELLGQKTEASLEFGFPGDLSFYNFNHLPENLTMSPEFVNDLLKAAEILSERAIHSTKVMTCSATATVSPCTKSISRNFVERAFRRAVSESEFLMIWNSASQLVSSNGSLASDAHKQTVKEVVKHVLMHPNFLYHTEGRGNNGLLQSWEAASRLSFTLLRSLPDEPLWADVKSKTLGKNYYKHIERLLSNSKVVEAFLRDFVGQWLGPLNFEQASITPELREAMLTEMVLVFKDFFVNNRDLREIFYPGFTYLNDKLALHYGIGGITGSHFRKVETQARGDLLRMGAFISGMDDRPTNRGVAILKNLLCESVGGPTGINLSDLELKPTLRETLAPLSEKSECSSCHSRTDPLGFGLDAFDVSGKLRTKNDQGDAIDSRGVFGNSSFRNVTELSRILSEEKQFTQCANQKLFTYFMSKIPGVKEADQCYLNKLQEKFEEKNYRFKDMIIELLLNPVFLFPGVSQ